MHRRPLVPPAPLRGSPPTRSQASPGRASGAASGATSTVTRPLPSRDSSTGTAYHCGTSAPHLPLPGGAVHHHAIEAQRTGVGEGRPQAGHLPSLHPHHRLVHRPWSPCTYSAPPPGSPPGPTSRGAGRTPGAPPLPARSASTLVPAPAGEGLRPVHPRRHQPRQGAPPRPRALPARRSRPRHPLAPPPPPPGPVSSRPPSHPAPRNATTISKDCSRCARQGARPRDERQPRHPHRPRGEGRPHQQGPPAPAPRLPQRPPALSQGQPGEDHPHLRRGHGVAPRRCARPGRAARSPAAPSPAGSTAPATASPPRPAPQGQEDQSAVQGLRQGPPPAGAPRRRC